MNNLIFLANALAHMNEDRFREVVAEYERLIRHHQAGSDHENSQIQQPGR